MASAQDTASFAAKLDTSGMVEGAAAGAQAIEKLRKSMQGETAELAEMQRALRNLKGSSVVSAASVKALSDRIAAQKASIAQAQQKYIDLGGSFKKAQSSSGGLFSALGGLLERAKATDGPVGALATRLAGLGKYAAAGGLLAIAAAAVVMTVAIYGAVAALGTYAVAQANAHRNELLALEAMTKARNYWGLAAGNATQMQQSLNKVAASSALSREEILGLEQSLYRASLRGNNLTQALEGLALVQQTQGSAAAAMFQAQVAGANMAGVSIKRLTDDAKARLGGIAARQMLDLNVQTRKLKENFGVLFQDLKVEGLLKALNGVTELFSQNTESGKALKVLAETIFQPLIDSATGGGPILRRFFQGIILQTLNVVIAVQKARLWFRQTFGATAFSGFSGATAALTLGKIAVMGLVGALGTLALSVGLYFVAIGVVVASVVGPVVLFVRAFKRARDYVAGLDFKAIGTALIDGLVNGIKSGVGLATAAMKSLGGSMLEALRKAFDSHSPSRIAASIGFTLPQGLAVGQRRGTPAAVAASRDMGAAVLQPLRRLGGDTPARQPAGPSKAAGGAGRSITVLIDKLICQGGASQEQAVSVKDALLEELTKIGISFGANLEPEPAT